ncbi:uncharacterized protein LOC111051581 [Nilaparvata lugens]|uniref:uncharacterized protein LOC111051581 n=1 Tax=Nilaparvata lugens TaxID=108931 RepID=UPI00193E4ABB|nr:uncharacterized protein LOC111051581 [Nilaparvata lugens]
MDEERKRNTHAFKIWEQEALTFQKDKRSKFQSRRQDEVSRWSLEQKIDAAYSEVGFKNGGVQYLVKKVLGLRESYYISFTYVHVKKDDDNLNYTCDVVCRVDVGGKEVFIDSYCRTYNSWREYLKDNKLPKGFMCYPVHGEYSAGCTFFTRVTPAGELKAEVLHALDSTAKVVGTVANIATVASLFIPGFGVAALGRAILKRALVASVVSNGYSASRNVNDLVDRQEHNQSISFSDAEARELWVNAVIYGFGTVTAGVALKQSQSVLKRGSSLLSRTARSAIIINCGMSLYRENLIVALDLYYADSTHGEISLKSFIDKCCLYFNIISPHHAFVATLEEIRELTSFLKIITGKTCGYLRLVDNQLGFTNTLLSKPVSFVKNLIGISGKFIINISLIKLESHMNNLKKGIKKLLKGDVNEFYAIWSETCEEILSEIQKAWHLAHNEMQKYGGEKENVFKRNDLDLEDFRNLFFMLNGIEDCFGKLEIYYKMKLITLMNAFLSKLPVETSNGTDNCTSSTSKDPVVACTVTEYLKRVRGFCLFLRKEVDIKIVEEFENKKLEAIVNHDSFSMTKDALRKECCEYVIDNFDIQKCVEEYIRCCSSSPSVASLEACGISQYFFVKKKTDLTDSEYLNIIEEKTSGTFNFTNAVVARKGNIVHVESIDEKALAIFFTQVRGPQQLEGALTCIKKCDFL